MLIHVARRGKIGTATELIESEYFRSARSMGSKVTAANLPIFIDALIDLEVAVQ